MVQVYSSSSEAGVGVEDLLLDSRRDVRLDERRAWQRDWLLARTNFWEGGVNWQGVHAGHRDSGRRFSLPHSCRMSRYVLLPTTAAASETPAFFLEESIFPQLESKGSE